MPSLAGNQVPTDLVTAVDLSATPTQQNVKSTLNDLFATITKNITDRAIRFQAPGSAPAVATASQGALYHNGTAFLASSNGGAYEQLYTLSAQSAALVFAGPTSGPAATPTFRALALTDLPAGVGTLTSVGLSTPDFLMTVANNPVTGSSGTMVISLANQTATTVFIGPTAGSPGAPPTFRPLQLTDLPLTFARSLYGRNQTLDGPPDIIPSTVDVLNWLQVPTSANLSLAVTDGGTGTGALVLRTGPQIEAPYLDSVRVLTLPNTLGGRVLRFAQASGGGNNCVELVNAANNGTPILRAFGSSDINVSLNLSSKGSGNITLSGAAIRAQGSGVTEPGIFEARGGNQTLGGGKILFFEQSTNGNNFVGFEAPDSISTSIYWTLPATDGTAGQVLSTNGAGILSWATRGTGTVTSVGLSAPSIFTVANSPVTGSGTLALSLAPQGQNTIFGGPITGGSGTPFFRFLQTADLPQLATSTILGRASAGFGTTESVTVGAGIWTWLQSATADNLRSAVIGDTGTGNLVFADAPTLTNVTVSSGNLLFSGQGQALKGEMSGALTDRFYLQTSAANNLSALMILPSASSSTNSNFQFYDRNDFVNNNRLVLSSNSATGLSLINSLAIGSATGVPLALATNSVNRITIQQNGNIAINGTSPNFGGGVLVVHIADATTTPSTFPTGGGILYASGGALRWRGPSTDTQIAPA